MHKKFLCLFLVISQYSSAQFLVGGLLGTTGYIGDLNDKPMKRFKPAIGASFNYEYSNHINFRTGFLIGKLEGGDKYSGSTFLKEVRNLNFSSELTEVSFAAELHLFNLNKKNWSPYAMGGIGLFHFNPYVKDSGKNLYLKPLSTEGQGLKEYPNSKPYALTQATPIFGGGLKFLMNKNTLIAFEVGWRRTFTDYLDDLSSNHIDPTVLLNSKGPKALQYSYRGNEVPGQTIYYPDNGYPPAGIQRGNPKTNDWYYYTGFHIIFRLDEDFGLRSSKPKKTDGCLTRPIM